MLRPLEKTLPAQMLRRPVAFAKRSAAAGGYGRLAQRCAGTYRLPWCIFEDAFGCFLTLSNLTESTQCQQPRGDKKMTTGGGLVGKKIAPRVLFWSGFCAFFDGVKN